MSTIHSNAPNAFLIFIEETGKLAVLIELSLSETVLSPLRLNRYIKFSSVPFICGLPVWFSKLPRHISAEHIESKRPHLVQLR
ncbi:hypothetical protein L4C34_17250 [Vibrio profundum]|uniref:hypothetical protein n=1 Tax=Vibrio profundum TaxID=2910247 RepID=UPI003D0A373C